VLNVEQFREDGLPYIAVAHGVRNTGDFANGANANIDFSVAAVEARLEASSADNTDFIVFHGGVDAPAIDLILEGAPFPIVNDLGFGSFSPTYLSLPAGEIYQLNLTDNQDNDQIVRAYDLDLNGQGGRVVTLLASGLLAPEAGQAEFALLLAGDSTGLATPLPEAVIDNVRDIGEIGIELFPNPVRDLLQVVSPHRIEHLIVTSMEGRRLRHFRQVQDGTTLDLSDLPAGMYVLQVAVGGTWYRKQVVVTE
jgi:hypothetical protein